MDRKRQDPFLVVVSVCLILGEISGWPKTLASATADDTDPDHELQGNRVALVSVYYTAL